MLYKTFILKAVSYAVTYLKQTKFKFHCLLISLQITTKYKYLFDFM